MRSGRPRLQRRARSRFHRPAAENEEVTARAAGLNARITVASVLLALVVMGAFALMVSTIQDLRSSSGAARASEKVIASANRLQNLALDLETGERGFVVSGNRAFLEPYATAAAEYRGLAHDLEHLVAADPTQFRRARELEAQIRAYHHAWAERVIATAARNPAAARRLIATAAGKARMDAIRIGFARFLRTEERAAAMHSEHSDDGGRTAILIGLGAVGGTAVLILVYALYLFRVVTAPVRRIAEGARRLADGALTTRVPDGGAGPRAGGVAGGRGGGTPRPPRATTTRGRNRAAPRVRSCASRTRSCRP